MNKLFCGVVAVAGSVLIAGVGAAETPEERGGHEKKSDGTEVPARVPTSAGAGKAEKWLMERHANPYVGKEETKELLRGKRPK